MVTIRTQAFAVCVGSERRSQGWVEVLRSEREVVLEEIDVN